MGKRNAHTLIELPVVIALLTGILTPTLGEAREQDKNSVCLGNQRQILLAASVGPESELDTHVAVDIVDLYDGRREPADDVGLGFAGYVFSVESEMMVTHLGSFDIKKDGLEEEVLVRLFNWDTGDVLAQGAVPVSSVAETTGLFDSHFTEIDPVTLYSGMTYAIVMDVTQMRDYYVDPFETISSWASGLTYRHGIRTEPDASSMPAEPSDFVVSDYREAYFGPNFKFSYVPQAFAVESPLERAVFQRNAKNTADVRIAGTILDRTKIDEIQFTSFLTSEGSADAPWQSLSIDAVGGFSRSQVMSAGGWYSIQVRALKQGQVISQKRINRIGVGEVFITAGQSNAANYGSPALIPQDDRISAWTGSAWCHAADPQPIATGTGGSPWSRLGDMLVADLDIPIGFISVGVGGTRVDEWVPGAQYYSRITSEIDATELTGFRAILWHQGEYDSLARTSAEIYAARLESIIHQTRVDAGWDIPWGIAIAAFMPQCSEQAEADVRAGQQIVINTVDNVFQGPNTDLLGSSYRSDNVHFNDLGLSAHAKGWLDALRERFLDLQKSVRVIDDFESYGNDSPNRLLQTWIDGAGFPADDFFPNGSAGNGTGSYMGYNPRPQDIMETATVHGGKQSAPFSYDNTSSVLTSETTRTFEQPWDWTASGVATLTLYFYGDPNNTGNAALWVKLGEGATSSAKVSFGAAAGEDVVALTEPAWTEWNIPLSGFTGVNLAKITSITLGVGPGNGSGRLLFDDIRLYPSRTSATTSATLVGWWKFDNDANDGSGNGNDGTLTGGATYSASGKIDAALSLDGIDDYVNCGNGASISITDAITLAAWVKTADAGNAQHNPYISKGNESYCLEHYKDNYLQLSIYDNGSWYNADGPEITTAFNDEWHHIAGTYDGIQLKLYLNGKLIASSLHKGAIAASPAYNLNIGRNSQQTDRLDRLFYGLIDDVRIYHGALPTAEIDTLANP